MFNGYFLAEALMGYVFVLAEHALHITAGKENRAAASVAGYTGLFPHMQSRTGNFHLVCH